MSASNPLDFAADRKKRHAAFKPQYATISSGRKLLLRPEISVYGMTEATQAFRDLNALDDNATGLQQLEAAQVVLHAYEMMLREFFDESVHEQLAAELRDSSNPLPISELQAIVTALQEHFNRGRRPLAKSAPGAKSSSKTGTGSASSRSSTATRKASKG